MKNKTLNKAIATLIVVLALTFTASAQTTSSDKANAAANVNQIAVKSTSACEKTIFGRSGLPAQFYQTYTYTTYAIVYNGKSTNIKGVGGYLTLGANNSFESELQTPGAYGNNRFKKSGTFCLDGENIVFNYADSKGEKETMKGTYGFSLSGLQLTLVVPDASGNGDRETYGLVIKGTEDVRRKVNPDGTITIDN